jgi:hypothetical protein
MFSLAIAAAAISFSIAIADVFAAIIVYLFRRIAAH